MNRRDLIIISALINAGLLIVLFATALKPDSSSSESIPSSVPMALAPTEMNPVSERERPLVATGDEVDQVLKEFAARSLAQQAAAPPLANPSSELKRSEESPLSSPFTPIAVAPAEEKERDESASFTEEFQPSYLSQSTPPPSPGASSGFSEVRVKKGDYLDKIARQHGCSVSEIMSVNQLKSTNLKIGQLLMVPEKKGISKKKPAASPPSTTQYYIVKNGDNPSKIAQKNRIKLSDLLRLNHLNEESARQLKRGDKLRIR